MLHVVIRQALCALVFLACVPIIALADDLTLAWDPPSGPAPAGYRVRYGPYPGPALQELDAGLNTVVTVTALVPGTTYEFHVVAYDGQGLTSGPSNFLRLTIAPSTKPPKPPKPPTPKPPPPPPAPPSNTTPYFPEVGTGDTSGAEPHRQFLAEGATSDTFSTTLSVANPTQQSATATIYLRHDDEARSYTRTLKLPPMGHLEADAASILGGRAGSFGVGVTSSVPVGVSRTMTWNGGIGGHMELATATPSLRWYFAEGSTRAPFDLFYLLFNPGPDAAEVSVRYMLPSGATAARVHDIPAGDRLTIWVDQDGPEVASTDVAAEIESLNGQPIVAERAMYLGGRSGFVGGHASLGAVQPRTRWMMAEGATGAYFTTYLTLANPNTRSAPVQLKFRRTDGLLVERQVSVAARSRLTLNVADVDQRLRDTAMWTEVIATDAAPIVAERVMWWPGTTWQDGHAASAAHRAASRWLAVGGRHGGTQRHATYVLVANTASAAQVVKVTVLGPLGPIASTSVTVAPASRYNVDMAALFPRVTGPYSVLIEAIGGTGALVVEQAMYWDAGGQKWAAGTAGQAKPLN